MKFAFYFFIGLLFFCSFKSEIPKKGLIHFHYINNNKDTFLFEFAAKDYIDQYQLKTLVKDTSLAKEYSILLDTLEKACNKDYTVVDKMNISKIGYEFFPNSSTLISLFKKRKINVFSLNLGVCKERKYTVKKHDNDYIVKEKFKNTIIYRSAYKFR